MRKPSTAAIKSFVYSRYVLVDDIGPFVPGTETDRLMRYLTETFDGIYCGILPDKVMGKKIFVRSAKTNRCFTEVRVK